MNVLVYLMFGAAMYLGVVKGHPDRSQYNKYDEMAVGMMVAACIFAVIDTYNTVAWFMGSL